MQPEVQALQAELQALTERVARLEEAAGVVRAEAVPPVEPARLRGPLPLAALGRAMLGLAGAYLLRALTESGTVAHGAGIAAGLVYAIGWMIAAAQTPGERRLETALHSLTSVLVLAPLLWEATLRFHAIRTWTAGGILLVFTACGLAVSWRKNILILATIALLAGLGTSAGLLVATYDVLPFTFVLLAIAALVEASACLDHWLSERWLAAVAADLALVLATWLATRSAGLPPDYAPIPHGLLLAALAALPAIYLASATVRTLLRGISFTWFETAQCSIAAAIAVVGCLQLSAEDPRLAPLVGATALAGAAACYALPPGRLGRDGSGRRNAQVYATFGILLALVGVWILLPGGTASLVWCGLSAVCLGAARATGRMTLAAHGAVYLLAGLAGSGALAQAGQSLLGTQSGAGWMECAGVALCALGLKVCGAGVLRAVFATGLAWMAAGASAGGLTWLCHAVPYCATLRTSIVAFGAVGAAWRARRGDAAFGWLTYALMLLGAYRLVAEDMHQAQKEAGVVSLLVYGAVLMALARISTSARES